MCSLKFGKWLEEEGLADETDEELIVSTLIKRLSNETSPRVLIEDFP
jgi:hypothetical protein